MDKFDTNQFQQKGFTIIESPYDQVDIIKLAKTLNNFISSHQYKYEIFNNNFDTVCSNILNFIQENPNTIAKIEHLISKTPEFFRTLSNPKIKNIIGPFLQTDIEEPLNFNGSVVIIFRKNSSHYKPESIKMDKQVNIITPIITCNNKASQIRILNNKANNTKKNINITLNAQELLVLNSSMDYEYVTLSNDNFNIFIQGTYYGASANIIEIFHSELH